MAYISDCLVGIFRTKIGDHDVGACLSKSLNDGAANTPRAAGYDYRFALEFHEIDKGWLVDEVNRSQLASG
jgi:hypothetical protein